MYINPGRNTAWPILWPNWLITLIHIQLNKDRIKKLTQYGITTNTHTHSSRIYSRRETQTGKTLRGLTQHQIHYINRLRYKTKLTTPLVLAMSLYPSSPILLATSRTSSFLSTAAPVMQVNRRPQDLPQDQFKPTWRFRWLPLWFPKKEYTHKDEGEWNMDLKTIFLQRFPTLSK